MMVTVAGYIAETLANHQQTWEQLVDHHIFTPLGMQSSNFMNLVEDHDDFAVPYMGTRTIKVPIAWEMFRYILTLACISRSSIKNINGD